MIRLVTLRILESYFRHRWLYWLPIVMMIGLGAYFTLNTKPSYTATGMLYVENQSYLASLTAVRDPGSGGQWWTTAAQATSQEIGELLHTDAFVRAIIQNTNLEEKMDEGAATVDTIIEETRASTWPMPLGNNQLLVSAVHEDPVIAYQIVSAVIEGYLQWRINADLTESETAQTFFSNLIETYGADVTAARDEMRRYLAAHPAPIRGERPGEEILEIDRLQAGIDLAALRYVNALEKEENTQLSMAQTESDARQTYFLIDAPHIPQEPNSSMRDLALRAAIFVVAGVLLSAGLIVGAAIIDRSFRLPIDVIHRLGLPVLSMIPDTTPPKKRFSLRRKTVDNAAKQPKTAIISADDRLAAQTPAGDLRRDKSRLGVDEVDLAV